RRSLRATSAATAASRRDSFTGSVRAAASGKPILLAAAKSSRYSIDTHLPAQSTACPVLFLFLVLSLIAIPVAGLFRFATSMSSRSRWDSLLHPSASEGPQILLEQSLAATKIMLPTTHRFIRYLTGDKHGKKIHGNDGVAGGNNERCLGPG